MGGSCSTYGVEERCIQGFLGVGDLRENDDLEDPVVHERITLQWIFRKSDVGAWTGSIWLRIGTGGEHL
jgi:hypothetical protein